MLKYLPVLALVALYIYSPILKKISPNSYSVSLPIIFDGPMSPNEKLDKLEKLHENEIHWPESMDIFQGKIYTGLGDGRIVQISNGVVKNISRTGKECAGQHEEHICGRPLGVKFSKKGVLYVVDAYHGLFSIDIKTGKKNVLVPSSKYVDGAPLTFLNGLTLNDEENALYMTQSSTRWNLSTVIISILEHDNSGRLLKYDIRQQTISVLQKDLSFPNGVELSHDKNSLLVAEGNNNRVFRYHLAGLKVGKFEELPMILPGEPDNISRSKSGNYWVGISNARTAHSPTLYDRFSHYPLFRHGFLIFYNFVTFPITSIVKLVPSKEAQEFAFELQNARKLVDLTQKHGLIVEFNEEGSIVQSLHSPSGNIAHISEVLEHDGFLYLGSWRNRFLGKLKI